MKKAILFLIPVILILEILFINMIFYLINQPSDVAVFLGVLMISIFAFLNYLLTIFIFKQFKTK